jgi:hypothetical protein
MSETPPVSYAVVATSGALDEVVDQPVDAWRTLAEDSGMLVGWRPVEPAENLKSWGPALKSGSSLAQQLMAVTERAGATLSSSGATLFRLELPTGQTLQNLVPAIGGGFRGLTRTAEGGSKIAGQARLFPVGGTAAGARLALGPLLGLMALSVGCEMLARYEQDRKLEAIKRSVKGIERHLQQELTAKLTTAEEALEAATSAMLDQITVPRSVGLDSAITGLHDVKHQALGWLEHWERGVEGLPQSKTGVPWDQVKSVVDVGIGGYETFPSQVLLLYRALTVDSRAHVIGAAEAALANPGQPLDNFEAETRQRLDENSNDQMRLREMLLTLSESPLKVAMPVFRMLPSTAEKAASLDRTIAQLAHAIVQTSDAPPILTPSGRQILEAVRRTDGSLELLQPRGGEEF